MEERILVLGGYDGTERLSSVECFKPGMTRTTWYQVPDMLHRRSNFSTCLLEGRLMVAGGYTKDNMLEGTDGEVSGEGEMYCPDENKWTVGPSLNIKRSALDCVLMDRGRS